MPEVSVRAFVVGRVSDGMADGEEWKGGKSARELWRKEREERTSSDVFSFCIGSSIYCVHPSCRQCRRAVAGRAFERFLNSKRLSPLLRDVIASHSSSETTHFFSRTVNNV